jgi:aryl-alcohol dehydrogenase-like predicted oxidoreductase
VNEVPYRRLGSTGLQVSRLCLGTATFGGQCDETTSRAILDRAQDLGITFLDTADKYPIGSGSEEAGATETIVGRWLEHRRDGFVLATKVQGATGPMPWDVGLSRRHIISAAEASLRRLRTDWIDLYQLHRPDPHTPIDETLAAMDHLVQSGKVRYVGVSNFLAWQLARAVGRAELKGFSAVVSVQARYNLLFREHERELLPLCGEEQLGLLAYNLLAGGLLSGKHDLTAGPSAGSRFASTGAAALYRERYWQPEAIEAVGRIQRVADSEGISLPTLAASWVLTQPLVTSVLVGATRPDHLDVPVEACGVELSSQAQERLGEITAQFRRGDAVQ